MLHASLGTAQNHRTIKVYGGKEVYCHAFLISALDVSERLATRLDCFTLGEGVHSTTAL
jgi:hypothetical protein